MYDIFSIESDYYDNQLQHYLSANVTNQAELEAALHFDKSLVGVKHLCIEQPVTLPLPEGAVPVYNVYCKDITDEEEHTDYGVIPLEYTDDIINMTTKLMYSSRSQDNRGYTGYDASWHFMTTNLYGIYLDNKLVAFRSLLFNSEEGVTEMLLSYVDEAYRGKGLYTALYRTAVKESRERGIGTLETYTAVNNTAMNQILPHFGFTHTRVFSSII